MELAIALVVAFLLIRGAGPNAGARHVSTWLNASDFGSPTYSAAPAGAGYAGEPAAIAAPMSFGGGSSSLAAGAALLPAFAKVLPAFAPGTVTATVAAAGDLTATAAPGAIADAAAGAAPAALSPFAAVAIPFAAVAAGRAILNAFGITGAGSLTPAEIAQQRAMMIPWQTYFARCRPDFGPTWTARPADCARMAAAIPPGDPGAPGPASAAALMVPTVPSAGDRER